MSGNLLFLGNKIFAIPPFFQTRPGDLGEKVHSCSLRFSALKVWLSLRCDFPQAFGIACALPSYSFAFS